jgi:hypothetical protein
MVGSIRRIRSRAALPVALFVLLGTGCNTEPSSDPGGPASPSEAFVVLVEPSAILLLPGETRQLRGSVRSSRGVFLPTPLRWTSADATIASVTGGGLVTALRAGQTTITATPAQGHGAGQAIVTVAR